MKNKKCEPVTDEFSKFLSSSRRSPLNKESDRGADFYNSNFQKCLKAKNMQPYSRFTDKGPSTAERVIRTIRKLLEKPVFKKENVDWLSELPSVIEQYNITIHSSTKMTPIEASKNLMKNCYLIILKTIQKFINQNLN